MNDFDLTDFEGFLLKNRAMRQNSVRTYSAKVRFFLRHFEKKVPGEIGNQDIIVYLNSLRTEELQNANSRRLARVAIERFYDWYCLAYSSPNPAKNLPIIKEYLSDPKMVSPDEIERLINACDEFRSDFLKKRNAAIISILASTGIRIEEFEKIKVGDVSVIRNEKGDPTHLELSVNAVKGSHARVVPFSAFDSEDICTNSFLRYYMFVLTETKQGRDKSLFWSTNRHGYDEDRETPLTRSGVNVMLYALKKKAYIEKSINIHQFRHYYATYSVINGIELIELQRLMGHSRITTTMRYIHIASRVSGKLLKYSPVRGIRGKKHQAGFAALGRSLFKS